MDFFVYWMLIDPKVSAANLIKRFQQTRDNQFWESVWRNVMFVRNILIIDKPSRGGLWKCTDTLSYSCQGLVKVILVSYFENKLPFEKLNLAIKQLWWNFYLNKWWEKEITFLAPLGSLAIGDSKFFQWNVFQNLKMFHWFLSLLTFGQSLKSFNEFFSVPKVQVQFCTVEADLTEFRVLIPVFLRN